MVFSSDLRRAAQTAELAFADARVPIRLDWRLRECNYGDLNGAPTAALQAQRFQHIDVPFPHGQNYRQVVDRVRSLLDDLRQLDDDDHVLLIGHTATRWALDHILCGNPLEDLLAPPFEWQPGWGYTLD